ncbi:MAG: septum formation initiator family protein [bacterium]
MKKSFLTKKIKLIIFTIVFAIIALYLFFNETGIVSYYSLQNDIKDIRVQIDSSKSKIEHLDSEIDSLKTNNFKIEKVAREKYHLKKQGEKVFRIKVK